MNFFPRKIPHYDTSGQSIITAIVYTVTDPRLNYHTISYERNMWKNMESLVEFIDDGDIKWYTIRELKKRMLAKVEDKWMGYEWVPYD